MSQAAWLPKFGVPVGLGTANATGAGQRPADAHHVHAGPTSGAVVSGVTYTKTTPNGTEMAESNSLIRLPLLANTMFKNFTCRITLWGVVTVNTNQPELRWRMRLGSNAATAPPVNAVSSEFLTFSSNSTNQVGIYLTWEFALNSNSGAAATGRGQGLYFNKMNTQLQYAFEMSSTAADTTLNTTVDNYLDITADWSQHGTGHFIRIDSGAAEIVSNGLDI